ncbi:hypothetical protein OC842_005826 [Tilletia horrida]|uniref:Uncharacterized protein n=1 Tax=Tilletia horrida TaxID=155126 RepID=A0AAN6G793_9BASI|nr:hypothetical protein OC842_005826 [Tilletia horrida]
MRFAIATTLLLSAGLVAAAPAPAPEVVHLQLPFGYHTFDVSLPEWFHSNDLCPDLKVSCVNKDGKTVGDIGKKPYEWDGTKLCRMKEPEKNSAECNAKFLKDCLAQCEAQGPLGGH